MVPLLTLTAYFAPAGHRATWFALMASLMNLALQAGALQTKYLNDIFPVARGEYGELAPLMVTVFAVSFILPIAAIALFTLVAFEARQTLARHTTEPDLRVRALASYCVVAGRPLPT